MTVDDEQRDRGKALMKQVYGWDVDHVEGPFVEYTVDQANDRLVSGARSSPRAVEEFWTFTRQAGLNFWMLSAIQTS